MKIRNVITMCHFNRPEYSRQVIESLRACDGIEESLLLPHIEPGNDAVRAMIEEIDFAECIPTFNAERFGVDLNTELALADGFRRAGFVIHIEDDVLCAPDLLRYFEWCCERFADDSSVFSITAYNRGDGLPTRAWHQVDRRHWFHPLACGTWKNRWQSFRGRLHSAEQGWDAFLNWTYCAHEQPGAMVEVYPELSRAQHIGVVSSLHAHSPEWYRDHHHVPHWAGDYDVPGGDFHVGPPS